LLFSITWSTDQVLNYPTDFRKPLWSLVASGGVLLYPKVGMVTPLGKYNHQHVLIADREPKVRSALKLFFESSQDCDQVGEAAHTKDVLKYVCRYGPDLILLDWELPGQALDYFMFILRMIYPDLLIIALGLNENHRQEALAAGADAFINKLDFPEQLVTTIDGLRLEYQEPNWEILTPIEA
jgi:CheY-like chemotaxis protein